MCLWCINCIILNKVSDSQPKGLVVNYFRRWVTSLILRREPGTLGHVTLVAVVGLLSPLHDWNLTDITNQCYFGCHLNKWIIIKWIIWIIKNTLNLKDYLNQLADNILIQYVCTLNGFSFIWLPALQEIKVRSGSKMNHSDLLENQLGTLEKWFYKGFTWNQFYIKP